MGSSPALDKIYYDYSDDVVRRRRRRLSIAGLQPNGKKWVHLDCGFFFDEAQYTHRIPRHSNFSVSSSVAPFEMKQKTHTQNTAKNRLQSFKGSNLKASCISPEPECSSATHSKRDWLISRILFLRPLSTWFLLSWLLLWLDGYLFF